MRSSTGHVPSECVGGALLCSLSRKEKASFFSSLGGKSDLAPAATEVHSLVTTVGTSTSIAHATVTARRLVGVL